MRPQAARTFFLFVLLILSTSPLAFEADQGSQFAFLTRKQIKFGDYTKDFIEFSKSGEYEPSSDLGQFAATSGDYAGAIGTLLEVHNELACSVDRAAVRPLIERVAAFYSKQLNRQIDGVNAGIAFTKKPGVAAEAIRLKDDMRDLQELFNSLKLQE